MTNDKLTALLKKVKDLEILDATNDPHFFEEGAQTSASSYSESVSSNRLSFCISCEDSRHHKNK